MGDLVVTKYKCTSVCYVKDLAEKYRNSNSDSSNTKNDGWVAGKKVIKNCLGAMQSGLEVLESVSLLIKLFATNRESEPELTPEMIKAWDLAFPDMPRPKFSELSDSHLDVNLNKWGESYFNVLVADLLNKGMPVGGITVPRGSVVRALIPDKHDPPLEVSVRVKSNLEPDSSLSEGVFERIKEIRTSLGNEFDHQALAEELGEAIEGSSDLLSSLENIGDISPWLKGAVILGQAFAGKSKSLGDTTLNVAKSQLSVLPDRAIIAAGTVLFPPYGGVIGYAICKSIRFGIAKHKKEDELLNEMNSRLENHIDSFKSNMHDILKRCNEKCLAKQLNIQSSIS